MTRHLIYFVLPVAGDTWRWNVEQLRARWPLFDGSKTVAVATSPGPVHHFGSATLRLDPASAVRDAFAGTDAEVLEVANDPDLGEVVAFDALWGSVSKYRGPGDVAFYGHAKGVKHAGEMAEATRLWADVLYRANLDLWPLIEAEFKRRKLIVGSMRQSNPETGRFIYSGNFFWFKNRETFARDWRRCRKEWAGVELWPGRAYAPKESACLFKDYPPGLQAYGLDWMRATAAEFEEFIRGRGR